MNRKQRRARKAAGLPSQELRAAIQRALARQQAGDSAGAEAEFSSALKMAPLDPEALFYYGTFLSQHGRFDEAAGLLTQAARMKPDSVAIRANLASAHLALGHRAQAAAVAAEALDLSPDDQRLYSLLLDAVRNRGLGQGELSAARHFPRLISMPGTFPAALLDTVISVFRAVPGAAALMTLPAAEVDGKAACQALAACPSVLALIPVTPINDIALEAVLTAARRHLLLSGERDAEWVMPVASALAQHCYLNEYVFEVTPEEQDAVVALAARTDLCGADLCVIGCYRPLSGLVEDNAAASDLFEPEVRPVIALQVTAPAVRKRLAEAMPALTAVHDDTSSAVRAQYEDNPYPRWTKPLLAPVPRTLEAYLNDVPGVSPLVLPAGSAGRPRVLVAGCGTGRHPIYTASAIANAEVLAVDLSRASLAYAKQKTEELGIGNIEYAQADILELAQLDDGFDVIESSGVLHHMADPLAGWRALVDLLKPGGVMKIGLYSEAGREGERLAQKIVHDKALSPDIDGIRLLRAEVKARAATGDQALSLLMRALAFHSTSECRDLVFHVMEHRFTIPEIEAALQALGLDFLGFHLPGAAMIDAFRGAMGNEADYRSLKTWHAFEHHYPLSFVGMYQFWCCKPF